MINTPDPYPDLGAVGVNEALHRSVASGTAPLQRIVDLARMTLGVSIAGIHFHKRAHEWLREQCNVQVQQIGLSESFYCADLDTDTPIVVADHSSPTRIDGLAYGFCALYPLWSVSGVRMGTFCLLDTGARTLHKEEWQGLADLARLAEDTICTMAVTIELEETRQQLASTLHRQDQQLADSPLAVVEWDAAIQVIRWSAGAERLFERLPETVLHRHPHNWGLLHESDRMTFGLAMARLRNKLEARNVFQARHPLPGGSFAVCSWHNSAFFDEQGHLLSIVSQVQDITAQHRLEEALRASEETFRSTFEYAPIGLAHVGLDGSWLKVNQAICDLLGYSREELRALTFQDITHPEDLLADLGQLRDMLSGVIKRYSMEKRYIRKSGWIVWARLTVSLHRDSSGRPLHFIAIVEDIEARKASESMLEQVRQNLEAMVEERTTALKLSHDALAVEVEQRHEAERASAANAERIRQILENSHEAFIGVDEQGLISDWNQQAEQIFGWTSSEAVGRSMVHTIIPPLAGDRQDQAMEHLLALAEHSPLDTRLVLSAIRKNGETFPVELTISVSQIYGTYHFGVFLHDITERTQLQLEIERKQDLLDAILDCIDVGVVACDAKGNLTLFNRAARDFHGLPLEEIPAEQWAQHYQLYGEDERTPLPKESVPLFRALNGTQVKDQEITIVRPQGKPRRLLTSGKPLVNSRGEKLGAVVAMNDITKRLQIEQALRQSTLRLKTITDNMPALIGYVDTEERYRFNNKMYEEWFGIAVDALYGQTLREVLGDEAYAVEAPYKDEALKGYIANFEQSSGTGDAMRYTESSFIPDYDDAQNVCGFYVMVRDITQRKHLELSMEHLARHDSLTGELNRRGLVSVMHAAIARAQRTHSVLAVMFLDIDYFKQINDRYGHECGDALLIEFAQRLNQCVRKTDTIGRLAGDEFVVVLEAFSGMQPSVDAFCRKILKTMAKPLLLKGEAVAISTSIGVVLSQPGKDDEPETLLDRADSAMYRAKHAGRNTYLVESQDSGAA